MPTTAQLAKIRARQERWDDKVTGQLPILLDRLLSSEVYGMTPGRPLPPEQYGVYLLVNDRDIPQYVGRVGLTERSRLAGKRFSSFRTRLNGHTRPRHSEGTYAYSRTCQAYRKQKLPLPSDTRAGNCADEAFMAQFNDQCKTVRKMGMHVVQINDNKLCAVFEIYAATMLGMRQSFAVS